MACHVDHWQTKPEEKFKAAIGGLESSKGEARNSRND